MAGNIRLYRRSALKEAFTAGHKSALADPSNLRDAFEAGERHSLGLFNGAVTAPCFSEFMAPRRDESPGSFNYWIGQREKQLSIPVDRGQFELIATEMEIEVKKGMKMVTMDAIEEAIRHVFDISLEDLRYNPKKKAWLKTPRFYAWYLAYHHCRNTLGEMGERWGNRNHASALHGARTIYDNCSLYDNDKTKLSSCIST